MGQALYRKYRPRDFSEVVGQETITKTLSAAVKSGRISHAYLFAGPRGVGKTSLARILAHRVNGIPYNDDSSHLDIIEIDAASNRRIDEIRDLREKVHTVPASLNYKIYIIDEVHMLTKEAFNALLKTLEEPPAHCIFILATTEAHKLPETIISRTQRFNFRPLNAEAMRRHLAQIAKKEKINIDDAALELLASHGEGSLRDITGMLDQLSATGSKISESDARNLLGIPPPRKVSELMANIAAGDSRSALDCLEYLKEQGANAVIVAKELSQQLRQSLLEGEIAGDWSSKLLNKLLFVGASPRPYDELELAVLEASTRNIGNNNSPPVGPKKESPVRQTVKEKSVPIPKAREAGFNLEQWEEILNNVRRQVPSLYTALRLAEPSIENGRLLLRFPFPLHQKKVKEARHTSLIARLMEDVTGAKLPIDCVVDKELIKMRKNQPVLASIESSELQTISNIFGSAEVLES